MVLRDVLDYLTTSSILVQALFFKIGRNFAWFGHCLLISFEIGLAFVSMAAEFIIPFQFHCILPRPGREASSGENNHE